MVITSLPSIQLGQHAVLTLPKAGISVCRLVVWEDKRAKGNRKVCCGHKDPSQSSGLRFPFGFYDFASGGRWQLQVAGGGCSMQPSTQSSTQSSIQSSVIDSALPRQTRAARGAAPTSSQCPEITKNQELGTAQISIHCDVTRSRPYPKAGTTPILDTPYSILSGIPTPTPTPKQKTSTPAPPTTPCLGRRIR